jgi:superfamily II DNA or RNA helicase
MIRPQQITGSWIARQTDSGSWQRGSRYFREGRARLIEVERLGDGGLLLVGSCRGSTPEPYRQHVEILPGRDQPALDGMCSCPVGENCKHVVALLLTWRATVPDEPARRDELVDWLDELDEELGHRDDDKQALLYELSPSPRHDRDIQIRFSVARQRKDGSWSKGRRTHPSSIDNAWSRPRYLRPIDEDILGLVRSFASDGGFSDSAPTGLAGHFALTKIAETGRAFWADDHSTALHPGPPRALRLEWIDDRSSGTGGSFRLQIEVAGNGVLVAVEPPCYVDPAAGEIGTLEIPAGLDSRTLNWLRRAPVVPKSAALRISNRLARVLPALPTPVELDYHDIVAQPTGRLQIDFDPTRPGRSSIELAYCYEDQVIDPNESDAERIIEAGDRLLRLRRDPDAEQTLQRTLIDSGLEAVDGAQFRMGGELDGTALRDAWFGWLATHAERLRADGWRIAIDGNAEFSISTADGIDGEVEQQGNDWFSLRFDLEFDGWRMPLLPLVSQLLANYTPGQLPETLYLDVGEGHYVSVPAEQIEPVLKTLFDLFDRIDDDHLDLARPDASRLLDFGDIPIRGATSLNALARKLADFSGLRPVKLPSTFKGELRPYQQQGLDWLQFLREHGFGGILADDMGLGKTVQTLAHLAVEKRSGRMQQPCLIVAPTSLMGNWRREAETFTPKLKVLVLHGPDRDQHYQHMDQFDLVLTTYPLLPRDRAVLLAQRWHCLILDEAQQIKNPKAKAAQVVRRLECNHRLCLTGTPMENHLGELWAQFDFLMPGFLGEQSEFVRNYRTPIERHNDGERLQRLQRRTAPFLLRRTKDRVAAELPPKTELLRTADFDPRQARLYESIRLTMEKKVRKAIASKGLARSHIVVLDALLKLRQVCCDPRLLTRSTAEARNVPSAKFNLLFDLLPELLEEGRRVLLFSQFTTMLGLIEDEVQRRGIAYTKLTGQTRKREDAIQCFRDGDVPLFLISLKAGGVGLNLVEADTVIHYDPWWNPAVEHQATDRAHRIGQDKPVFVYKLVAAGTVEEKILALQERKQKLADGIYGERKKQDQPPIDADTIQALLGAE